MVLVYHEAKREVHFSRAIYPFHTLFDGDVLFMVTTNEIQNEKLDTNTGSKPKSVLDGRTDKGFLLFGDQGSTLNLITPWG
ncbi:MAG: hypothetical protein K0Q73_7836, partial [Paenibacillus sp.]|nr:hypothetical protein [Paenibacillus sp.]